MSIQTQSHKFAAVVLQNLPELPDDMMQNWIQSPQKLQIILTSLSLHTKIFKTIKIGTGFTNIDELRLALNKQDGKKHVTEEADRFLSNPQFKLSETPTNLDLVVLSLDDLGLGEQAYQEQVYAQAMAWGLQLCPNEVGPQLYLQYPEQPIEEHLVIAMKSLAWGNDEFGNFSVANSFASGRLLRVRGGKPWEKWANRFKFVFVKPRK